MRINVFLLSSLAASAIGCASASAQVSFDPRALNQLNAPPAPSAPASTPQAAPASPTANHTAPAEHARPRTPERRTSRRPVHEPATKGETEKTEPASHEATERRSSPAKPPAKPPASEKAGPPDSRKLAVPPAPPPTLNLPPPIAVPVRPPTPPLPAAVTPEAKGAVSALKSGIRLTFGPDSADLNPETDAAIKAAVHAAPPFDTTTFNVDAYAAGTPDDPSTARRLALSRALAVRSVLISEGIPSVRVYVKALGATGIGVADGPPDRVDLIVNTLPPASQQKLP